MPVRKRHKLFAITACGILLLAGVLLVNTLRFASLQPEVADVADIPLDDAVLQRLAVALRYPTISQRQAAQFPEQAFLGLQQYLERAFPVLQRHLSRQVVNNFSLLYSWQGTDSSLNPVLLLAHLDVVPAENREDDHWRYPPFAGEIAQAYLWGRGALDDKAGAMAILEAVENLLGQGFQPRRTILIGLGHDEEIGGHQGAARIADLLAEQGTKLAFVLDEGLFITDGIVPGVNRPVALIGIAEKGYVSIELSVSAEGGHSSMPPPHTAVGILGGALWRLEQKPMSARLAGPVRRMFGYLGPEMDWPQRAVFANLWLFSPLVLQHLAASASTNAAIRTTIAATQLEGSPVENMLPRRARAVVNCRILPGDSSASVMAHVRDVIADPRVSLKLLQDTLVEPTPVSAIDTDAFRLIGHTVRQIFPDALIAPALVIPGTDSRHYAGLTRNIYRFRPLRITADDLPRFHGINERILLDDYQAAIRFYIQLIQNTAS